MGGACPVRRNCLRSRRLCFQGNETGTRSALPIFRDFDQENLVKTAEGCGEILSADGGLDHVLLLIRSNLPKKLRETAYAVALEVAAADLDVKPEETRFLEMLGDSLELDQLTTTGIERGIRARNRVL